MCLPADFGGLDVVLRPWCALTAGDDTTVDFVVTLDPTIQGWDDRDLQLGEDHRQRRRRRRHRSRQRRRGRQSHPGLRPRRSSRRPRWTSSRVQPSSRVRRSPTRSRSRTPAPPAPRTSCSTRPSPRIRAARRELRGCGRWHDQHRPGHNRHRRERQLRDRAGGPRAGPSSSRSWSMRASRAGVTEIVNQGTVTADDGVNVPTDDPDDDAQRRRRIRHDPRWPLLRIWWC